MQICTFEYIFKVKQFNLQTGRVVPAEYVHSALSSHHRLYMKKLNGRRRDRGGAVPAEPVYTRSREIPQVPRDFARDLELAPDVAPLV